jgi:uncharacterized protein YecE (DUF72 family)
VAGQLDMFGAASSQSPLELAPEAEPLRELAARMPSHLRMGTSSWTFPGWEHLVWDRPVTQRLLTKHGLAVYSRHPLFRTVGLDRTYYGPMSADELAGMVAGLPNDADLRLLVKAHAECTTVQFPDETWLRSRAGQRNELFLDVDYARQYVVEPFIRGLGMHGGVLLFQFPPQYVPGGARNFAIRLQRFLAALPSGPQYAVEIRNSELFTPRYVKALDEVGAAHCVAELPGMPDIRKQWEASGGSDRPALVMRWMLARKHSYETGAAAYAPFDRVVDDNLGVRRAYAEMILATPKPAYLIVNNKAEGSSPGSVIRMAQLLAEMIG